MFSYTHILQSLFSCAVLGLTLNYYQLIVAADDGTVERNAEKPHIILILADDLGFDDVSFRGSNEFLTPNIDALAYHGRILERLYAPSICTPSRGALMTGRFPIHTGTQHFVISNEEPWGLNTNYTILPEIFQKAGYSTNLVGKWHLGFAKREFTPTYRGFDYHYGYWGGFIDYYHRRSQMPFRPNYSMGFDFYRNMEVECDDYGTYMTDLLTHEAERIILANNNTKPLLLLLSHLAVHAGNENAPLEAPADEIAKFHYIKDPNRRKYAAMVSRLDQSVGQVIHALEKANMLQNSIVIFQSDNGGPSVGLFANTASNWPFRGQKNSPWEGGVRVAGAIWSPLIRELGSAFHPTMYIGDWLPTLAAAANIPPNSTTLRLDGLNLWPALSNHSAINQTALTANREIVHNLDDIWHVAAMQRGDWKYVNGTTSAGRFDNLLTYRELYDTDPRSGDYFEAVRNSTVSEVLRKYDEVGLTREHVNRLRTEATIRCGNDVQHGCNPLVEECLYNVAADPCERNNLAPLPEYNSILRGMRKRIRKYRSNALPAANRKGNYGNSPARHRCLWTPFLEETPSEEFFVCGLYGMPCSTSR